jgi:tetratricopeptide (TPR) repeat protein
MALRDDGQLAEAEAELLAMADDFPDDPRPFGCLFGLLQMQSLDPLAIDALKLALQRSPNDVGMLIALGREQLLTFDFDAAKATFKRVIELDPSNGDAFLGIADAYERADPEQISALIEEAKQNGVDNGRLNLMRALLARRERKFEEGLAALDEVPENVDVVRRWHLQAQLLDGAKRFDEAFAAFDRANSLLAAEPTNPLQRAADQRERLRGQLQQLTPEWRESWQTPPLTAERPSPVFLLGFPRSGTTLLDTMLMGHPTVEVMEEKPILSRLRLDGVDVAGLPAMDEAAVRSAQERYFELAADFATLKEGTVLVDKSPLHMQHLAQIHRLFPDARIILALRHPVDVVLSAFMAKFRPNNSMANFLRIDTAAEFYDLTFALWERALALFPAEVHPVVYEEMIDDPEASLRPLVAKLGIEWDQSVLDHQTTAKARGIITTASYDQVTQPLYRRSAGRWKHYRRHLEPILPILRPWVEKFGYEL